MRIYALGVQAAGGDHDTMLAYVPIMLGDTGTEVASKPPTTIHLRLGSVL